MSLMVACFWTLEGLGAPKIHKDGLEVGRASENRPEDPLQTEREWSLAGSTIPSAEKTCGGGSLDFFRRSDVFRTRTPWTPCKLTVWWYLSAAKNMFLGFFGHMQDRPIQNFDQKLGPVPLGFPSMHLLLPASCKTPGRRSPGPIADCPMVHLGGTAMPCWGSQLGPKNLVFDDQTWICLNIFERLAIFVGMYIVEYVW